MSKIKYPKDLVEQALQDLEATDDVSLVARKYSIPIHAIYRFRREKLSSPQISKDKKIKELSKNLSEKELEVQILRELLKKTYQVMPIV